MRQTKVQAEDERFLEATRKERPEIRVGDFGCGVHKLSGAIGVDVMCHRGIVDVVHDLDEAPWPFKDNSFDAIRCNHLIEHVEDVVPFFEEAHRVLTPGGYIIIRTPHYSNVDSFSDPTHKRHLTSRSLDYFIRGTDSFGLYSEVAFCCEEKRMEFSSGLRQSIGRWLCRFSTRRFEKYYCKLFPARTLYFRLRAIKDGWTPQSDTPRRVIVA